MNNEGTTLHMYYILEDTIRCRMDNFTGYAYRIPYSVMLKNKNSIDGDRLKHAGVYMLLGTNDEGKDTIYIGKATDRLSENSGVITRILEPHEGIEWSTAIIFISSDLTWGASEVSYLENKFYLLATEAKRYIVKNDQLPPSGSPIDEISSALDKFLEEARIMLPALGCNVLEPVISQLSMPEEETLQETALVLEYGDIIAYGCRTDEGFAVLKGSEIRENMVEHILSYVKDLRERYDDKLDKTTTPYTLKDDLFFRSPTAAASFVTGASLSGPQYWRDENTGKSLREMDIEAAQSE